MLPLILASGLARHRRVGCTPVGRHEAVAYRPVVADGHEDIAIAAEVVEADLGEDREVAGDACLVLTYFGEADVRHVVADDSLDFRRLCGRVRCGHDATRSSTIAARPRTGSPPRSSSSPSSQKH